MSLNQEDSRKEFCSSNPSFLNIYLHPLRWRTLLIYGYAVYGDGGITQLFVLDPIETFL